TGGKPYKVSEGETLNVEKLAGKPNEKISFEEILLIVDEKKVHLGRPLVKNAVVTAEILEQKKDKKIRVATYKAKSRNRKVKGHRQLITVVKIVKIGVK
ncbi:MAG: 50S ribosomal protein L21, partial [Patescibacteria group bacterium]|nr:50S ribosomal protein L21 [Patescibacteria group bacterium]